MKKLIIKTSRGKLKHSKQSLNQYNKKKTKQNTHQLISLKSRLVCFW